MITPEYFLLWAKTDKEDEGIIHPLIYHLLDVGQSALALWQYAISEQSRIYFSTYLGLDKQSAGVLLGFWAALHDLGKAAPGFQRMHAPRIPVLEEAGFVFPKVLSSHPARHGILTSWALKDLFFSETGLAKQSAYQVALALGGHHGSWPTGVQLGPAALGKADKGDSTWDTARLQLFQEVHQIFRPINGAVFPVQSEKGNALLTLLSGLVSVSDWIGSMAEFFPFTPEYMPLREYKERTAFQAKNAIQELGWLGWKADGITMEFSKMFPFEPNTIQKKVIESSAGKFAPTLAILEAPTGIGKTEAALQIADSWLQQNRGSGLYIAMPTQATSNQMYERFVSFLMKRYAGQNINAHLVHGAAALRENEHLPQPGAIAQDDKASEGTVKAETWFLPRKRTLLANFGVGTVDQALLSVLQTKHFFVRLFGLGQKVVIFDEVHAYDTYMTTLFERLLSWLHAAGTSVVILSATLSEKTTRKLVGAWLGKTDIYLPGAEYPRLTVASGLNFEVHELPPPVSKQIFLVRIDAEPDKIAAYIAGMLEGGGCAAVICNRIQRAQEVYQAVKEQNIIDLDNLILFHARFPFEWRKEIEEKVLSLFSKTGRRPEKAVVVATQVIEQSLDLDFDLIISDLAPLDLLIQRAGRMHRHDKNNNHRPHALRKPCLVLAELEEQNELPDFGADTWIYEPAILLKTWYTLLGRDSLNLPAETDTLIEMVYGDKLEREGIPQKFQAALHKAEQKACRHNDDEILQAKLRLVPHPADEELLSLSNEALEEDNPALHEALRALTRLSDPSVSLVCLHRTPQGISLEPEGYGVAVDLTGTPDLEQAKQLVRHAVSIQRREAVDYFINNGVIPQGWREISLLRYHYPVIFEQDGFFRPEGTNFELKLSRELGLEISRKEGL